MKKKVGLKLERKYQKAERYTRRIYEERIVSFLLSTITSIYEKMLHNFLNSLLIVSYE